VRIRAYSVFEGVVYHCAVLDRAHPCRPTLEVEAVIRPGDADTGPLLLTLSDYAHMAGGADLVRPCIEALAARGRIVTHLGVEHLAFPTWTPIDLSVPGG
jgi:hypothetical protein